LSATKRPGSDVRAGRRRLSSQTRIHMPGTLEKHESLNVNDLNRANAFRDVTVSFPNATFRWPWLSQLRVDRWHVQLQFDRSQRIQTIAVVWSWCHFGGWRPWFRCTYCKRRVGKLFNGGSLLACRKCCNLRYASQRRGAKSRRFLQALKIRLRLGGLASITEPFPERPRRMHRRTYLRLRRRAEQLEQDLRGSRRFLRKKIDYSVLVPK
jgi:hypothetical protein